MGTITSFSQDLQCPCQRPPPPQPWPPVYNKAAVCPLAPLVYLFISQALLRLLKTRGFGIEVAGHKLTALMFADDSQALLDSFYDVPRFLEAMATFAEACGQTLNLAKKTYLG